ncbi:MAG TPA: hypothetical protein VK939_08000 [Longimicrobiales bacterium]|nr:hypothetical protein [Longimicrobiales bacterium]
MNSYLLFAVSMLLWQPVGTDAQRPDYQAVRDSLAATSDLAQLRRLERAQGLPGAAATPEPLVRRGLIALRLYELTRDRDEFERSRDVFERAVERFPGETWSHYGLALAYTHGPDARLPFVGGVLPQVTVAQSVAEIFGRDARSRARRSLRAALALEPGFGPAAVLLADLAMADGRRREQVEEARGALLRARGAGDRSAAVARALSDVETSLGNYAAAAAAADGGAGAGDASALRSRGIALMLQPETRAEGWAHYQRALDELDGGAARLLYQDVAVLVNAQEAAEWQRATAPAQQQLWLRRFWDRRAADGGVTPEERVAEHYRRLTEARTQYVRNARRGSENPTGAHLLAEQAPESHIFDDRGVILIRHGTPLQAIRTGGAGVLPNETWVYQLPGQEEQQLFHFVALRGAQDFSLVGDILDAVEPSVLQVEKTLRGIRPATAEAIRRGDYGFDANTERDLRRRELAVMSLIEDRAAIDSRYRQGIARLRQLLQSGYPLDGTEIRSIVERTEADYRRGARLALRTDSHVRTFAAPIDFHHDVFSFRNRFGRTEVTAAVAAPADQLDTVPGTGGTGYALRLSLILNDTLQDVITRVDTLLPIRVARPLPAGEYVRAHVTLPVVPSEHTVYRVVTADAVGARGAATTGGSRLRDFGGRRMVLSDVVLALPDSAGDWRRGDVRLALALPRSFGPERPFTVFYEVYNLPPDVAYQTRVVVTPAQRRGLLRGLFGGGGERIDLRFDDVARPDAEGVVQEVRRLASDLRPGRYRLEITVSNRDSGENATTSTAFTVLD